jgi:peptide/nickel transport system permease protein
VLAFALDPQILPAVGYVGLTDNPGQWFLHLVLPALSLSIAPMAVIARQTRASVATVMNEDYIRTANAKGLARTRVITKHALKNAAVPVVTVFGLEANRLIGGTVVIETIFTLPGVGQQILQAVGAHDLPVISGIVICTTLIVLLTNLIVDIISVLLNPRLRTP